MSDTLTRNYRCKDVEVLTVSSSITRSAQTNLEAITQSRPLWKDPFFPDLQQRIDNAFQKYLGVDNAADLRAKTAAVLTLTKPAKESLSTFKINVSEDFKSNKPRLTEILTVLGFNAFWKQAGKGDQEGLIQLLYTFQTGMTGELQTEITTAGTSPALITQITGYTGTLKDANISQEFAKAQRPLTSAAAVTEFNGIYNVVSSVCKICHNMFKDNAALKSNFSFAAVKRRLNAESVGAQKPTPVPAG